ncbi:uncharacterized protein LOC113491953 isoform X1 [Trichoplusia ni]|uniref:Uncharacterized protein LOC113491953 isoform X1 n=1 Tax=Trichoplusia ni TaxID=7111 RepID=A0A7E5V9N4_TRINI|nr:uncharacterized protein LOC113491953 isoform X1 [Trichoplusia ni]
METESNTLLNQLRLKHENHPNTLSHLTSENSDGLKIKLRALLVALLGVSMSACAFASQPVELELDDDDVAQKLNNVSFARRITKPTIRLVMGYGKLSAFVTAITSLLLLVAVMSKLPAAEGTAAHLAARRSRRCARCRRAARSAGETNQSWWRRGARWLAAPALLVAALEVASDTSDAMLAAALRGSAEPARVAAQTAAAALLITVEILVWYFIAKFFEYNPPPSAEDREKDNLIRSLPQ